MLLRLYAFTAVHFERDFAMFEEMGVDNQDIRTSKEDVEVVIPTIRSVRNLAAWREALQGVHVIVVQDGDPTVTLEIPDGLDVTVWARPDVEALLGEHSWIISTRDSACRCFGFLVATARHVFTLDDDCLPPPGRAAASANPLVDHLENLRTPSHPDYFNTLYDIEFVRGYPHELRAGQPTAISHGLWLEHPDLDAVTQRERPDLRIRDEIPIVQTVPRGVPYSMCGMNLAFDRQRVGAAMYFGLMGDGQPWGRYDDMWAGWCSKIVCDHHRLGVKTGRPYIVHDKQSDWRRNLEREAFGMRWASELHRFFSGVRLADGNETVEDSYLELADHVGRELGRLDPYFQRLAEAMRVWIEVWRQHAAKCDPASSSI